MNLSKRILSVILSSFLIFQLLFFSLTSALAQGTTVNMEYDNRHPLHAPKKVNSIESQYDANGNLKNDGERIISWNQDNLPTKIERNSQIVEFFYDADGRRIVKKVGENKTVYVNQYYERSTINPSTPLGASNQQSSSKYYFAENRRIAQSKGAVSYLYYDHLGSMILITDSQSQSVSNVLQYFPFGNLVEKDTSNISYLFTGQEYDTETALYNYRARLYNSKVGSFISADILEPGRSHSQGLNRYAYVENNPLRYTDPTGLRIPEETPEEYRERITSQISGPEVSVEPSAPIVDRVLEFALFMKEKFGNMGVTAELWESIRPQVEKRFGFGISVAEAITRSVNQFPILQCVGFTRASLRTMGLDLPPLGSEIGELGRSLAGYSWFEDLQQVEPGDVFVYTRQVGDATSWHWAIVTEKIDTGESGIIKLTEAVGSAFQSGDIDVPAGAIMVNVRTVDLSTGEIFGMDPEKILGFGFYRPKTEE